MATIDKFLTCSYIQGVLDEAISVATGSAPVPTMKWQAVTLRDVLITLYCVNNCRRSKEMACVTLGEFLSFETVLAEVLDGDNELSEDYKV